MAMLVATATGARDVMLLMAGRSGLSLVNQSTALGVNLVLNVLLIPPFGIAGAAMARACALLIRTLLALVQVRRILGMPGERRVLGGRVGAAELRRDPAGRPLRRRVQPARARRRAGPRRDPVRCPTLGRPRAAVPHRLRLPAAGAAGTRHHRTAYRRITGPRIADHGNDTCQERPCPRELTKYAASPARCAQERPRAERPGVRAAGRRRALPPIPAAARVAVSTAVLRRPWKVPVRFDQLLVGAQGGWTAREFADRTGDLLWPSTLFLDGPHVALLRLADERPDLSDDDILESATGGSGCAASRRAATTSAAPTRPASSRRRAFIARYRGEEVPGGTPRPQQSGPQDPVLVAPVRGSEQYQILDGHHRLAIAAMGGADGANVVAKWLPVTTPCRTCCSR